MGISKTVFVLPNLERFKIISAAKLTTVITTVTCLLIILTPVENANTSCPDEPKITILDAKDVESYSSLKLNKGEFNVIAEDEKRNIRSIWTSNGIISLECLSVQPVTWEFHGNLERETIESVISSRNCTDPLDTSTFCYSTVIRAKIGATSEDAGTGYYICSHVRSKSDSKWTFLYVYGKSDNGSIKRIVEPPRFGNEKLNLGPQKSAKLKIELQRLENDYDYYKDDQDTDFNLCHQFTCYASDDIQLGIYNSPSSMSLVNANNLTSISSGAGVDHMLSMSVVQCNTPSECQLLVKFLQDPDTNFTTPKIPASQNPNLNVCSSTRNNLTTDTKFMSGAVVCQTNDKMKYQYVLFYWSSDPRDGILLYDDTVENISAATTEFDTKKSFTSNSDSLESRTENQLNRHFADLSSVIIVDTFFLPWDDSEIEEIEGHVGILCTWPNFPFARGPQLLMEYTNGTRQSLQSTDAISDTIFKVNSTTHFGNFSSQMNTTVRGNLTDIKSFVCILPLWNSDKWANATFPFTAPSITNASDINKSVYDTDENITIFCEVEGSPPPYVNWYHKDRLVDDKFQNGHYIDFDGKKPKTELTFTKASPADGSNIAGEYTCKAENPKGSATHKITIQVKPYSFWIYVILSLGILFLISIITLVVCIYKNWKLRKQLDEKFEKDLLNGIHSLSPKESLSDGFVSSEGTRLALKMPYNFADEIDPRNLFLGKYAQKLGKGNFGTVVKASIHKDNEVLNVAVKLLETPTEESLENYVKELKTIIYANKKKHENIVGFIGAVTKGFPKFIIMELCEERSLQNFLIRNRSMFTLNDARLTLKKGSSHYYSSEYPNITKADLVLWSFQLASGMKYLESIKIIHRDLAIRNLLLTKERQLKISDFGLSKVLKPNEKFYTPTKHNPQQATPWQSLALECFEQNIQSFKADVWAFGVAVWEIFSLAEEPNLPPSDFDDLKNTPFFGLPNAMMKAYLPTWIHQLKLKNGDRLSKPIHASSQIYGIMLECWNAVPEKRPTFSQLFDKFKNVLAPYCFQVLAVQNSIESLNDSPLGLQAPAIEDNAEANNNLSEEHAKISISIEATSAPYVMVVPGYVQIQ